VFVAWAIDSTKTLPCWMPNLITLRPGKQDFRKARTVVECDTNLGLGQIQWQGGQTP
jgi:hypothetical protein